eukprot:Skav216613  [mRNA]  locus=scaffold2940:98760:109533:+ [translate_table: standard]
MTLVPSLEVFEETDIPIWEMQHDTELESTTTAQDEFPSPSSLGFGSRLHDVLAGPTPTQPGRARNDDFNDIPDCSLYVLKQVLRASTSVRNISLEGNRIGQVIPRGHQLGLRPQRGSSRLKQSGRAPP